jgi:hypothetical protein
VPNRELKSRGTAVQLSGVIIFLCSISTARSLESFGVPSAVTVLAGLVTMMLLLARGRRIYRIGREGIPEGDTPGQEGALIKGARVIGAFFSAFLLWLSVFKFSGACLFIWGSDGDYHYALGAMTSSLLLGVLLGTILFTIFPRFENTWVKSAAWACVLSAGLVTGVISEVVKASSGDLLALDDSEFTRKGGEKWAEEDFHRGQRRILVVDVFSGNIPGIAASGGALKCLSRVTVDSQLAEREGPVNRLEFAEGYNQRMILLVCP